MILPWQEIVLVTDLPPAEVARGLAEAVEPRRIRWRWFGMKVTSPFEGTVDEGGFSIRRIIGYRNSFLPRLDGRFEDADGRTRVKVRMTLHPFVLAFMALWLGGVAIGALTLAAAALAGQPEALVGLVVPVGMLCFGMVLPLVGFVPEAIKARRLLCEILEATPEETAPDETAGSDAPTTLGPQAALASVLAAVPLAVGLWLVAGSIGLFASLGTPDGRAEATVKVVEDAGVEGDLFEPGQRMAGYVFESGGRARHGTGPVGRSVRAGDRIEVAFDPDDPDRSRPVGSEGPVDIARLGGGCLLAFGAVVLWGQIARRVPPGRVLGQAVFLSIGAIGLALGLSLLATDGGDGELLERTRAGGDWGEHRVDGDRVHYRIAVLAVADDTTAYAQRATNEVDFQGLAFGNHSGKQRDLAFVRFLLEIPTGSRIESAHLVLVCNSNAHQAGSAGDEFAIALLTDDRDFDRKRLADYDALLALAVAGTPVAWPTEPWLAGQTYRSPDVAALVQARVDDPGYAPGDHIGLRIGPARPVDRWDLRHLRYAGAAPAQPAVLEVVYRAP